MSCELLSNYCIFDIIDNTTLCYSFIVPVVNCFQIIVSLTLLTTQRLPCWVWRRCELLSNYCIFDIIDNRAVALQKK